MPGTIIAARFAMKRLLALALMCLGTLAFAVPAVSADRDMPSETPEGLKLAKRPDDAG